MDTVMLGRSSLRSSRLAYGCWRLAGSWNPAEVTNEGKQAGQRAVMAAYESGYTLFDTANIYTRGVAESILGSVLKQVSGMRERILIATKGGIRPPGDPAPECPARYDFSREHLIAACEESLKRLGIETIDLYMLHRPDYLAEPDEISAAFAQLRDSGKVRYFGISNFRPSLVTALQSRWRQPLVVNQVEISLAWLERFEDGTLDQCLAESITPMAWSPLAAGIVGGGARQPSPSHQKYSVAKLLPVLDEIANARGTHRATIALAWLLKHPAKIVPIVGSLTPARIRDAVKAMDVQLSREEWYRLFVAARDMPLP